MTCLLQSAPRTRFLVDPGRLLELKRQTREPEARRVRLVDAIDGERRIGELVDDALPPSHRASNLETTRSFFERLWWYDQVVFDLSSNARDAMPGVHDFFESPAGRRNRLRRISPGER